MRSASCCAALACLAMAGDLSAHEFWIEPSSTMPAVDAELTMQVRVGEHFQGDIFPFQPRAYETAYWVGPETVRVLQTKPLARGDLTLSAEGRGLHMLAVSSFGRRLSYASVEDFVAFAKDVGAGDVVSAVPPKGGHDGTLSETYRRFSKTLVHFGIRRGSDRRLGLDYEWVQSEESMTLFAPLGVVPRHAVDVFCRLPDTQVRHQRLYTDKGGRIAPDTFNATQCMASTVFLTPPAAGQSWISNWVSVYWVP